MPVDPVTGQPRPLSSLLREFMRGFLSDFYELVASHRDYIGEVSQPDEEDILDTLSWQHIVADGMPYFEEAGENYAYALNEIETMLVKAFDNYSAVKDANQMLKALHSVALKLVVLQDGILSTQTASDEPAEEEPEEEE